MCATSRSRAILSLGSTGPTSIIPARHAQAAIRAALGVLPATRRGAAGVPGTEGDLAIRSIYHQTDERIEAHILVAFMAYRLQVTLKQRLRSLAPELTPNQCWTRWRRSIWSMCNPRPRMVAPSYCHAAPNRRRIRRSCSTVTMSLPAQPPPRVTAADVANRYDSPRCGADLATISHGKSRAWAILTVQLRVQLTVFPIAMPTADGLSGYPRSLTEACGTSGL